MTALDPMTLSVLPRLISRIVYFHLNGKTAKSSQLSIGKEISEKFLKSVEHCGILVRRIHKDKLNYGLIF